MTRQKLLLGILVVLALITARVYLVPSDAAPSRGVGRAAGGVDGETGMAAPASVRPAVSSDASGKEVRTLLALRIGDLSRTPRSFTTGRDPWRFVEPPPPPPVVPKPPSAAQLQAMREAEEARQRLLRQQQEAAEAEARRPKPAPFTWNYLGSFGSSRQRIAVFTDGQRVYNAREGDILEGKFIVAQIGYESVDIRFVGFPQWPAERLAVKH